MQPGSTSDSPDPQNPNPDRPGPWPPRIEPFVRGPDHNPKALKSWAKRTGFNTNSGELSRSRHGKGVEAEVELGFFSDSQGEGDELREREAFRPGGLKCGVTENPDWEIQAWI